MGNCQYYCCADIQKYKGYKYGEDIIKTHYSDSDQIKCKDTQLEIILKEFQSQLKNSSRLFKDPQVNLEPILIKQVNQNTEIYCSYKHSCNFINDPQYQSTKICKIFEVQNNIERNQNKIKTNNKILQNFGVFLCFLIQKAELIKQIILTNQNSFGLHAIKTYANNKKKIILIDDYILCNKNKPLFSEPIDKTYIWPCLLEKVWLKIKQFQNNRKMRDYSPLQIYRHFLQFPTKTFLLQQSQNQNYQKQAINQKKKIINELINLQEGFGCFLTAVDMPAHLIGLTVGRYYYFITCIQFDNRNLLYLRNPCGNFQFRGKHSIIQPNLKSKLKKKLNIKELNDSDFILEQEEFFEQISQITISYYNKDIQNQQQKILSLRNNIQEYILFQVEEDCFLNISLIQQEYKNNKYFPVTYEIINLSTEEIIQGINNQQGWFGLKYLNFIQKIYKIFIKGSYLLRLKKKSNENVQFQRTSSQGEQKIVFTSSKVIKINNNPKQQLNSLFLKGLIAFFGKLYDIQKIKQTNHFIKDIDHIVKYIGDLVIIYIKKINTQSNQLNIQIYFPNLRNLQCISHKFSKKYQKIQLNQDQILIIFEKIDLVQEAFLGNYEIQSF